MSLGPYLSPFFDVPEMDDNQRALDEAMRRLRSAIQTDTGKLEKRSRRIKFATIAALAVPAIAILITIMYIAGALA